jgi:pyruvate dehydrogenase E1 component beta subunit
MPTYKEAIRQALREEMAARPKSVALGQDIGGFSLSGITAGLSEALGPERVRDCPISESAMVGMAVGLAMKGYVAMIELAYADISAVAFSSLVHSAAKLRYASNGTLSCPLVLRSPIGRWSRHGPMGTEVTASWYCNVPDLAIAMPATPAEAYWDLKRAFGRPIPTLFLEDKSLYGTTGEIDGTGPGEAARVVKDGRALTIVAAGRAVQVALEAAERLEARSGPGEIQVVSLGHVRPFDAAGIRAAAEATGRVLVVQDEPPFGGYGPMVQSCLAALPAGTLRCAPRLLARPDGFLPYVREEDFLPDAAGVARAATELLAA